MLGPGILVALSLAIPPRARATGFSVASLWVIPGLLVLPLDRLDLRPLRHPLGDARPGPAVHHRQLSSSAARRSVIDADIAQVWRAPAARSEALYQRRQGQADLLLVRGVSAGYDDRQVLFDVDIDVKEGEIVALLGTNGAGKSTLLKAISGVVEADRGAVVLDGRDITHAPPNEIAALGHQPDAGRSGRVRLADRRREPAPRRMDPPPRPGRRRGGDRPRCSSCSRCCASAVDVAGRRPVVAASSRCSRSAWRSSPGRGCC